MKKATFITNAQLQTQEHVHPWKQTTPFNTCEQPAKTGDGLVLFRCEFDLPVGVRAAVVRATALGVFDLFVNGLRVGTKMDDGMRYDELKPEWTDYKHRVFSYEYDLLPLCGDRVHNTLVAVVSQGWWAGQMSCGYYCEDSVVAFCGEIEVTGADGRSTLYASAPGWQTAIGGPIRAADIWDGEYYDARVPDPSLSPEAYDWSDAVAYEQFDGIVEPFVGDPLRVHPKLTRTPVSAVLHDGVDEDGSEFGKIHVLSRTVGQGCEAIKLKVGQKLILDMGQNMVGRPRITIAGAPSGTMVTGIFAEMLNDSGDRSRGNDGPAGSMYVENYRRALSRMTYIAAGRGTETYEPTHTYYGFRYLELHADADIEVRSVQGRVVFSDMKETGMIETDHPLVNQLISKIVWGMRGNYFSNPTDCPQRDERYGWTGDTQIFCGAGAYFYDTHRFMRKWLGDVRACQASYDGEVGDIIPTLPIVGRNAAAWGDAAITVPYQMWRMFRDETLLADHYEAMESYMHSLEQYGMNGPKPTYGDWLCYDVTDKTYIGVCYYAFDAYLMSGFSKVLARCETKYEVRAAYYHHLREKILAHWRATYLKDDGSLTEDTQTGYLLALAFGMIDEESEPELVENFRRRLRDKIESNDYCLSTGFVGTGILNRTLGENGMNDLAYSLLLQTKDPSWLYSVLQGATTVWERWNSYTVEKGFGPVGMNSFNHYAYGAVAEWMFGYMAGIRPDPRTGGFEHFVLAPEPDTRTPAQLPKGQTPIRHVKAHYDSRYGRIESAWDAMDDGFRYCFTVPMGSSATVILSVADGRETLCVNGVELSADELCATVEGGRWHFEIGTGSYTIV
ncbi:MAG: family 78 glycoside hydrolase catalytic domain [Clostridia bacterium]|nr:family 78 glycoside hydrolase catalytic domain [Clostridia bacterium]